MTTTVNISAHIPIKLAHMLDTVSKIEERSKSYYIKKALLEYLERKLEDIDDLKNIEEYEANPNRYKETVSWEDMQIEMKKNWDSEK